MSFKCLVQDNFVKIKGLNDIRWHKAVLLICLLFFLKVNNPVSVLTQEMSKYFLHSKGEGDKYKVCWSNYIVYDSVVLVLQCWQLFSTLIPVAQFFMKATQLEQMREDFVYIKTTKHATEDKVGQHSEVRSSLTEMVYFKLHAQWYAVNELLAFIVDEICNPLSVGPLALLS